MMLQLSHIDQSYLVILRTVICLLEFKNHDFDENNDSIAYSSQIYSAKQFEEKLKNVKNSLRKYFNCGKKFL